MAKDISSRGGRGHRGDHGAHHRRGGKNNPRRGGPGILLTCETGRERKCEREGLEILRHYYYRGLELKGKGAEIRQDNDLAESGYYLEGKKEQITSKTKELSLDDEIAMLKRGATADEVLHIGGVGFGDGQGKRSQSKKQADAPFSVFETGCRGTVFVMCTLPKCNLVPLPGHNEDEREDDEKKEDVKIAESGSVGDKRKATKEDCIGGNPKAQPMVKKLRIEKTTSRNEADSMKENPVPSRISTSCELVDPPWDPIDTVHRVIENIEDFQAGATSGDTEQLKHTPSSRFVTRMIPIQATCFASLDDIRATARALVEQFLLPPALNNNDVRKEGRNAKTTFKIEFKRRNCSTVTRTQIIDAVAGVVGNLGNDRNDEGRSTASSTESQMGSYALHPLFAVDLDDPDYTILVEICRTLCGMSVVPRCGQYKNFNLFEIRQQKKEDHKIAADKPVVGDGQQK